MKDIILLPTYNERENVAWIIPEIFSLVPDIHVLVIDDNSPDQTAEVVRGLASRYPNLSLIVREKKTGLGNAYKDTMRQLIHDQDIRSLLTMDADGSHSPEYLKELLTDISDYDLVIGSRYVAGGGVEDWEPWRKFLSRFGNMYSKFFTGLKINDFTAGFMCIRREFLERLAFEKIGSSGYSFLIELKFYLIHDFKARVKEVPIIFKSRREGESKISHQIIREGIKAPLRLFLRRIWKK